MRPFSRATHSFFHYMSRCLGFEENTSRGSQPVSQIFPSLSTETSYFTNVIPPSTHLKKRALRLEVNHVFSAPNHESLLNDVRSAVSRKEYKDTPAVLVGMFLKFVWERECSAAWKEGVDPTDNFMKFISLVSVPEVFVKEFTSYFAHFYEEKSPAQEILQYLKKVSFEKKRIHCIRLVEDEYVDVPYISHRLVLPDKGSFDLRLLTRTLRRLPESLLVHIFSHVVGSDFQSISYSLIAGTPHFFSSQEWISFQLSLRLTKPLAKDMRTSLLQEGGFRAFAMEYPQLINDEFLFQYALSQKNHSSLVLQEMAARLSVQLTEQFILKNLPLFAKMLFFLSLKEFKSLAKDNEENMIKILKSSELLYKYKSQFDKNMLRNLLIYMMIPVVSKGKEFQSLYVAKYFIALFEDYEFIQEVIKNFDGISKVSGGMSHFFWVLTNHGAPGGNPSFYLRRMLRDSREDVAARF